MMWRKNEEAKPSSPGAKPSEPPAATAKQNQTAISNVSTPASSAPVLTSSSTAASPVVSLAPSVSAPTGAAPSPVLASAAPAIPTSTSTIGAGLKIRGDISGNSNLIIEGEAQGKIQMTGGRVTVAATGRVNADIEASEINIDGHVQGNLKATNSVSLGPASHVQGSVLTRRIAIEDGAGLRGKVEMIRATDSASAVASASSEPNSKSASTTKAATAAGSQGD